MGKDPRKRTDEDNAKMEIYKERIKVHNDAITSKKAMLTSAQEKLKKYQDVLKGIPSYAT